MQLRKVVNHGNVRWRVTTLLNGKRKQRFFESREGARGWIKLLNADDASGGFWGQRTVAERDEIISAFNASRERQVPLLEAILIGVDEDGETDLMRTMRNLLAILILTRMISPHRKKLTQLWLHLKTNN